MIKFVIRDDDTSFFTKPEELKNAYSNIRKICPISLAVIPFDVPTYNRGDWNTFRQNYEPKSIKENNKLAEYIIENKVHYHIMLHGYYHIYKKESDKFIPEFKYIKFDDATDKIDHGKKLLEELFNQKITEFVPPSNYLNIDGARAININKLLLLGSLSRAELAKDYFNIPSMFKRKLSKNIFKVNKFKSHKELRCHSLTPLCNMNELYKLIDKCNEYNGTFVLATHYWELDKVNKFNGKTLKENLIEIINYVIDNYEVEFIKACNIKGGYHEGCIL